MAAGQTMIGRDREVAELEGALTRTALGAAEVVVIAGEPGIGKTRLLLELIGMAGARGWTIGRGRATELERESPLAPFVEALETPLTELAGAERFGRYLWGAKTRFQPEAHFG
jgi:predicted ATPase